MTDGDWYRYLAACGADEVNFWRPGGATAFRALSVGEPFFFKSHFSDGNGAPIEMDVRQMLASLLSLETRTAVAGNDGRRR